VLRLLIKGRHRLTKAASKSSRARKVSRVRKASLLVRRKP
jgi:hypothetical protein